MHIISRESDLTVSSYTTSEISGEQWVTSPHPLGKKAEIWERQVLLEQAAVLLLEDPTDQMCQRRLQQYANEFALFLRACGFSFAAKLVLGIEQMLIKKLFFEDSWRSQLAEFIDAVHVTIERQLCLTQGVTVLG